MHPLRPRRAGVDEQLVAALEVGPAEVVGGEILLLQIGAGGAVEDDDALVDQVQVPGHGVPLAPDERVGFGKIRGAGSHHRRVRPVLESRRLPSGRGTDPS